MESQEEYKIRMVSGPTGKDTRNYEQTITKVSRLGKELKISPKASVQINKAGFKNEWFVPTATVLIGIGKDHTADLIMDVESWEALKAGAEIHITTAKEFRTKFLGYKR